MSSLRTEKRQVQEARQASHSPTLSSAPPNRLPMIGNQAMAALLSDPILEMEADRAAAAVAHRPAGVSPQAPMRAATQRRTDAGRQGAPLDARIRLEYESKFGHDFSSVRIHTADTVSRSLRDAGMLALTHGEDIAFASQAYQPGTVDGNTLLAHELAHVVQQRGGSSTSAGLPGLRAAPVAPQAQENVQALTARLQAVRARLATLRREQQELNGAYEGSLVQETQRRSLAEGTRDLHSQARADTASRSMWGGSFTSAWVRRVVSATQSGSTITLTMPFQISYLALTDAAARARATADSARIVEAIRSVWQVDIADGEYAGIQFRVAPSITYLANGATRSQNAFLIEVRGADTGPSQGIGNLGTISLAPVHLDGQRVIVIAHELMHLFGFTDNYLHQIVSDRRGRSREVLVVVGAQDPAGRADPLGIIDPTLLSRALAGGTISQQDVTRQTTNVRIWQEHASQVLRSLGVLPPPPARPTIDDDDFDPGEELHRMRREGEARLAPIRERRSRVDNSLRWMELTEEIMRLEGEERGLQARLAGNRAP